MMIEPLVSTVESLLYKNFENKLSEEFAFTVQLTQKQEEELLSEKTFLNVYITEPGNLKPESGKKLELQINLEPVNAYHDRYNVFKGEKVLYKNLKKGSNSKEDQRQLKIFGTADSSYLNKHLSLTIVHKISIELIHKNVLERKVSRFKESKLMWSLNNLVNNSTMKLFSISMMCPITTSFMQFPGKSLNCKHSGFFCLKSYLNLHLNTKISNKRWTCPICSCRAFYAELYFDELLAEVISKYKVDHHKALQEDTENGSSDDMTPGNDAPNEQDINSAENKTKIYIYDKQVYSYDEFRKKVPGHFSKKAKSPAQTSSSSKKDLDSGKSKLMSPNSKLASQKDGSAKKGTPVQTDVMRDRVITHDQETIHRSEQDAVVRNLDRIEEEPGREESAINHEDQNISTRQLYEKSRIEDELKGGIHSGNQEQLTASKGKSTGMIQERILFFKQKNEVLSDHNSPEEFDLAIESKKPDALDYKQEILIPPVNLQVIADRILSLSLDSNGSLDVYILVLLSAVVGENPLRTGLILGSICSLFGSGSNCALQYTVELIKAVRMALPPGLDEVVICKGNVSAGESAQRVAEIIFGVARGGLLSKEIVNFAKGKSSSPNKSSSQLQDELSQTNNSIASLLDVVVFVFNLFFDRIVSSQPEDYNDMTSTTILCNSFLLAVLKFISLHISILIKSPQAEPILFEELVSRCSIPNNRNLEKLGDPFKLTIQQP
jgi:hypothetical protein